MSYLNKNVDCIDPYQYCPSCPYGIVIYPEWCETYEDTLDCIVKWVCTLPEKSQIEKGILKND